MVIWNYLITAIKKEVPKETIAYREIPLHHQDIFKKHFEMGQSICWSGFSSETTSNSRDMDKSIFLRLHVFNGIIIGEHQKKSTFASKYDLQSHKYKYK